MQIFLAYLQGWGIAKANLMSSCGVCILLTIASSEKVRVVRDEGNFPFCFILTLIPGSCIRWKFCVVSKVMMAANCRFCLPLLTEAKIAHAHQQIAEGREQLQQARQVRKNRESMLVDTVRDCVCACLCVLNDAKCAFEEFCAVYHMYGE